MARRPFNNRRFSNKKNRLSDEQEDVPRHPVVIRAGTVTSLEIQKKNNNRISVFLDDTFAFGLHQDTLLQFSLRYGQKLTAEEVTVILAADALLRAKEAAVTYLGHRARSENEVRTKLRQKSFSEETIDQVIARLYELSYLNDAQFAFNYTRDRFNLKGYGPHRIRSELMRMGVSAGHINEALETLLQEQDVIARAREEAEKRLRRLRNEPDLAKKRRKLFDFLMRRGHTSDVARVVIESMDLLS